MKPIIHSYTLPVNAVFMSQINIGCCDIIVYFVLYIWKVLVAVTSSLTKDTWPEGFGEWLVDIYGEAVLVVVYWYSYFETPQIPLNI